MEKNFVLNGNKLIINFLIDNTDKDTDGTPIYETVNGKIRWVEHVEKYTFENLHNSKYHTSWDWLMPVVEKIQNLYDNEETFGALIDISTTHIQIKCKDFHYSIGKPMKKWKPFDIMNIYRGIIEFIEWYNENNKSK